MPSRKKTPAKSSRKSAAAAAPQSAPRRKLPGLVSLAALAAAAAGAAAIGAWRLLARTPEPGTVPTDLMGDEHPDGSARAIDAFRPDPTAPVPAAERGALRPALAGGAAPTLVTGQARENARAAALS